MKWVGLGLFPYFDRQHRAVGLQQNPLGVAPEDELPHLRPPAESDDDQGSIDLVGDVDELISQVVCVARLSDRRRYPGIVGPLQQSGDLVS